MELWKQGIIVNGILYMEGKGIKELKARSDFQRIIKMEDEESMASELIINVTFNETRIAFLENGVLVEFFIERKMTTAWLGTYTREKLCELYRAWMRPLSISDLKNQLSLC